jgi:hypothetical protein
MPRGGPARAGAITPSAGDFRAEPRDSGSGERFLQLAIETTRRASIGDGSSGIGGQMTRYAVLLQVFPLTRGSLSVGPLALVTPMLRRSEQYPARAAPQILTMHGSATIAPARSAASRSTPPAPTSRRRAATRNHGCLLHPRRRYGYDQNRMDETIATLEDLGVHIEAVFCTAHATKAAELHRDASHLGPFLGDRACLAVTAHDPDEGYALTAERAWNELPTECGITVVIIR